MLNASTFLDLGRLPELFCGFPRRREKGPTLYPVACSPQAWAAAAFFMLLGACLGLGVDAPRARVRVRRPILPRGIDEVRLANLRVGPASIDLLFQRQGPDAVTVLVPRRDGRVDITVIK
jgi:glycogen debranching enzyme